MRVISTLPVVWPPPGPFSANLALKKEDIFPIVAAQGRGKKEKRSERRVRPADHRTTRTLGGVEGRRMIAFFLVLMPTSAGMYLTGGLDQQQPPRPAVGVPALHPQQQQQQMFQQHHQQHHQQPQPMQQPYGGMSTTHSTSSFHQPQQHHHLPQQQQQQGVFGDFGGVKLENGAALLSAGLRYVSISSSPRYQCGFQ